MTHEDPRSLPGGMLFDYMADADEQELKRMLGDPDLTAKDVILAELDRRKTQEVNRELLRLNRWIVGLAAAAVLVAVIAVLVAVGVALGWGPL